MTIVVQEFDGSFSHSIVVDDFYTVHDLPCHSKLKKYVCAVICILYSSYCMLILFFNLYHIRSRKRKMVVSTGEEVEIDVSGTEYVCV